MTLSSQFQIHPFENPAHIQNLYYQQQQKQDCKMKKNIFNVDDRDCKDSVANTNDTHISCKLIDYEELRNAVKHLQPIKNILCKHSKNPNKALL